MIEKQEPAAWIVFSPNRKPIAATVNSTVASGWKTWGDGYTVEPLYLQPQATPTDAEISKDSNTTNEDADWERFSITLRNLHRR